MKEKGISRDVGKGRSRSTDGGPGLNHVNRMAVGGSRTSQNGERRRRRHHTEIDKAHEERHHQRNQSILMRWSMVFGLLALVVLSLFVMFWLMPYFDKKKVAAEPKGKVFSVIEEPKDNVPGEREAVSIAKKALAATQVAEVERYIQSDTQSPEEIIEFLRSVVHEDGGITRYDWLARLDTSREDISGVVVTFQKDGELRNRLVLLTPDEAGNWKMDFAAFARAATPSWSELMEGTVNSAVVRVYVAPDHYFNGPFNDQDGWRCYGIASPDMPELFYGYCLAGSAQDKVLSGLLMDRKGARATIGIEKTPGASNRQFKIKRVLAEDWVIRDAAADETVK